MCFCWVKKLSNFFQKKRFYFLKLFYFKSKYFEVLKFLGPPLGILLLKKHSNICIDLVREFSSTYVEETEQGHSRIFLVFSIFKRDSQDDKDRLLSRVGGIGGVMETCSD